MRYCIDCGRRALTVRGVVDGVEALLSISMVLRSQSGTGTGPGWVSGWRLPISQRNDPCAREQPHLHLAGATHANTLHHRWIPPIN
jgi:hypothetical protein